MAEPRERLFRDDAGAALERVARLEEENRVLRSEIERIKNPRRDTPTLRPPKKAQRFALGASVGLIAFSSLIVLRGGPGRHSDPQPPPRIDLPASPRPVVAAPTLYVPPQEPLDDGCSTVYFYDSNGVKHYKLQCLHPERTAH